MDRITLALKRLIERIDALGRTLPDRRCFDLVHQVELACMDVQTVLGRAARAPEPFGALEHVQHARELLGAEQRRLEPGSDYDELPESLRCGLRQDLAAMGAQLCGHAQRLRERIDEQTKNEC